MKDLELRNRNKTIDSVPNTVKAFLLNVSNLFLIRLRIEGLRGNSFKIDHRSIKRVNVFIH